MKQLVKIAEALKKVQADTRQLSHRSSSTTLGQSEGDNAVSGSWNGSLALDNVPYL
jgi:hypothetical protein